MNKKKKLEELIIADKEIAIQNEEKEKRMGDTLYETKEYLENLLNYANAPIIVWNTQYKITRFA